MSDSLQLHLGTHQAPPSMGFSRQKYWSGLPFPSLVDLPNPGVESRSPTLQADSLSSEPLGKIFRAKQGFLGSSACKESACNAGDPGSREYSGEGIGYPLQYSWASLVAQLVKNLPAMWETWIPSLGWEDPLEEETAICSSILTWRILWTVQSMGLQRVRHDFHFTWSQADLG